jgi:hypothetical protein
MAWPATSMREAFIDRVTQGDIDEVGGADYAHGSDAGFERDLGVMRGMESLLCREAQHGVVDAGSPVVVVVVGDMHMRVDEAWQQCCVAEIDDARAGGNRCIRANRDDALALDDDETGLAHASALAVEQMRCLEHDDRGCAVRGGRWLCVDGGQRAGQHEGGR